MSTTLPRILHVSGRTFWCGESNRVIVVCKGLKDHGWPVTLGAPASSEIARRAIAEGIPVDTRFQFQRGFRPFSLWDDVMLLRQGQHEHPYDVVHLHTSVDTWPAALAFGLVRHRNQPQVVRTRHSDHKSKSDPVHQWLYRRAIDHVVLSAAALRVPLKGLFDSGAITDNRMTVIHSSVNIHRFDPARVNGADVRRELGLEGRFCIGLIGRVSREKGHDLILAALPDILKVEPGAVCVFAGEGDQVERLRREVAAGPLKDHVVFAGFRNDIPEVTAAMDLLVVPSLRVESSPGVVKEGMAMGVPVIASDVGGVAEIIQHGVNGLVVPLGDAVALRDAVIKLIADKALYASIAACSRQRVVEHFSDERLVENNMALYLKLLGRS